MADSSDRVATGPAVGRGSGRGWPVHPLDRRLAAVARRHPGRPALRSAGEVWTFAEWNAAVDRLAGELAGRLGAGRHVVAVASTLDVHFAVAYYAVLRSGNVIAPVNPLTRPEALERLLATADVRLALLPAAMADAVAAARPRLPALGSVLVLADAVANAGSAPVPAVASVPGDLASILFTSGTTGPPKAVRLSHRNLSANAAQVAWAHGLDTTAVAANTLPTYHPMHLNSAMSVAAEQVLIGMGDPVGAIDTARDAGATHVYGLPVMFSRLAEDPRLGSLVLPTARLIASGGSALAPPTAERLARHFGVPVVQGYGLAETSPLTHSDGAADPRPGSVGRPVAGTACRVVGIEDRAPLPAGRSGEVQVRGPQVMLGYLGDAAGAVDAEGWFSTGDVGRMDDDGTLYLVDRIGDVFKCDNWLVAPREVEEVLCRHPDVAEGVVVGLPDRHSGAVAGAVLQLAGGGDAATVVRWANERLAAFQHIRAVAVVDAVPRSPTGKIVRRQLRDGLAYAAFDPHAA